jgi:hypothetical protein
MEEGGLKEGGGPKEGGGGGWQEGEVVLLADIFYWSILML